MQDSQPEGGMSVHSQTLDAGLDTLSVPSGPARSGFRTSYTAVFRTNGMLAYQIILFGILRRSLSAVRILVTQANSLLQAKQQTMKWPGVATIAATQVIIVRRVTASLIRLQLGS